MISLIVFIVCFIAFIIFVKLEIDGIDMICCVLSMITLVVCTVSILNGYLKTGKNDSRYTKENVLVLLEYDLSYDTIKIAEKYNEEEKNKYIYNNYWFRFSLLEEHYDYIDIDEWLEYGKID